MENNILDYLGADLLANEVSNLILSIEVNDKGKMFGIFGQWGRGKTYLINKIWNSKKFNSDKIHKIHFNVWKYQDAPATWAYFYEILHNSYLKGNFFEKLWKVIKLNIKRFGFIPYILSALFLFAIIFGVLTFKEIKADVWIISFFVGGSLIFSFGLNKLFETLKLFRNLKLKRFYTSFSYKPIMGIQSEIVDEIKSLVKVWFKNPSEEKIIIFIDDIDRCTEDKIISVIDSLRILLDEPEIFNRVSIIVSIDENFLKSSILLKFKNIIENYTTSEDNNFSNSIITEYLDKLFLSAIKLGVITPNERKEILQSFFKNGSNDITKKSEQNIGTNDAQKSLQEKDFEILNEFIECYTDATPRQIKIFCYRYLLAKNLLLRKIKYDKDEVSSISYLLAGLLMKYTLETNIGLIGKDKRRISQSKKKMFSLNILGDNKEIPTEHGFEILSILEIVMPY
jgi:hypothetical protein